MRGYPRTTTQYYTNDYCAAVARAGTPRARSTATQWRGPVTASAHARPTARRLLLAVSISRAHNGLLQASCGVALNRARVRVCALCFPRTLLSRHGRFLPRYIAGKSSFGDGRLQLLQQYIRFYITSNLEPSIICEM